MTDELIGQPHPSKPPLHERAFVVADQLVNAPIGQSLTVQQVVIISNLLNECGEALAPKQTPEVRDDDPV